jgi:uncharacterized protein YjlB
MSLVQIIKRAVQRITPAAKLEPRELRARLRDHKPTALRFKDDGVIPNNKLPLVLYRGVVNLEDADDPAAVFEQLFAANGWGDSWRDGIYDYVHYHSRIHEVLGIAGGVGRVRFGGDHGKRIVVKAGDVVILPAGTGHQCLGAGPDFLVVGAYPPAGTYDECTGAADEHARALETIARVPRPRKDPVFGGNGELMRLWGGKRRRARTPKRAARKHTAKSPSRTGVRKRAPARRRAA